MNQFRDNPYQSPEPIVRAELAEPPNPKKPEMLPGFPAGACAFLIVIGFMTMMGWWEIRRSRDEILFALTAAGTILSLLLTLRLVRWTIAGV